MIYDLEGRKLVTHGKHFVANSADLIGAVELGVDASVWFGVVIRADNDLISIGDRSNIQDNSVLHTDIGVPLRIGKGVTVGHRAMLHGCTVGDNTLIGMGATILNGARIGSNCIIGAGALITEGKEIPDGSMAFGAPAKVVRSLHDHEVQMIAGSAEVYVANAERFRALLRPRA